jgi:hypothetical protein
MPHLNLSPGNNFNYPSSVPEPMPSSSLHSSPRDTNSHLSTKHSLSFPQLFAIYTEIVTEWSQEKWLTFVDNHQETYLTLDSHTRGFLTIQMAIDQYYLTSGTNYLLSPPDCLLIRTKSRSENFFIPNSILSLENLCDTNVPHSLFQYKLMAIVCHLNESHSKIMFYKDYRSNNWYIYFDQTISSHSHSNVLSNEQQTELETFIQQQENQIDGSKLASPLSALCNHPIIYVYIPEKSSK